MSWKFIAITLMVYNVLLFFATTPPEKAIKNWKELYHSFFKAAP